MRHDLHPNWNANDPLLAFLTIVLQLAGFIGLLLLVVYGSLRFVRKFASKADDEI